MAQPYSPDNPRWSHAELGDHIYKAMTQVQEFLGENFDEEQKTWAETFMAEVYTAINIGHIPPSIPKTSGLPGGNGKLYTMMEVLSRQMMQELKRDEEGEKDGKQEMIGGAVTKTTDRTVALHDDRGGATIAMPQQFAGGVTSFVPSSVIVPVGCCLICGFLGHHMSVCPRTVCYQCRQPGHMGHRCTFYQKNMQLPFANGMVNMSAMADTSFGPSSPRRQTGILFPPPDLPFPHGLPFPPSGLLFPPLGLLHPQSYQVGNDSGSFYSPTKRLLGSREASRAQPPNPQQAILEEIPVATQNLQVNGSNKQGDGEMNLVDSRNERMDASSIVPGETSTQKLPLSISKSQYASAELSKASAVPGIPLNTTKVQEQAAAENLANYLKEWPTVQDAQASKQAEKKQILPADEKKSRTSLNPKISPFTPTSPAEKSQVKSKSAASAELPMKINPISGANSAAPSPSVQTPLSNVSEKQKEEEEQRDGKSKTSEVGATEPVLLVGNASARMPVFRPFRFEFPKRKEPTFGARRPEKCLSCNAQFENVDMLCTHLLRDKCRKNSPNPPETGSSTSLPNASIDKLKLKTDESRLEQAIQDPASDAKARKETQEARKDALRGKDSLLAKNEISNDLAAEEARKNASSDKNTFAAKIEVSEDEPESLMERFERQWLEQSAENHVLPNVVPILKEEPQNEYLPQTSPKKEDSRLEYAFKHQASGAEAYKRAFEAIGIHGRAKGEQSGSTLKKLSPKTIEPTLVTHDQAIVRPVVEPSKRATATPIIGPSHDLPKPAAKSVIVTTSCESGKEVALLVAKRHSNSLAKDDASLVVEPCHKSAKQAATSLIAGLTADSRFLLANSSNLPKKQSTTYASEATSGPKNILDIKKGDENIRPHTRVHEHLESKNSAPSGAGVTKQPVSTNKVDENVKPGSVSRVNLKSLTESGASAANAIANKMIKPHITSEDISKSEKLTSSSFESVAKSVTTQAVDMKRGDKDTVSRVITPDDSRLEQQGEPQTSAQKALTNVLNAYKNLARPPTTSSGLKASRPKGMGVRENPDSKLSGGPSGGEGLREESSAVKESVNTFAGSHDSSAGSDMPQPENTGVEKIIEHVTDVVPSFDEDDLIAF